MFSRSKFRLKPFGNKRKNYSRNLIFLNRRRHHDHDYRDRHHDRDDSVMMSGDSPGLDSRSIPASYDLPDDARPGELPPVITLSSTGKLSHNNHDHPDNEMIEEVATVKKTLPSPEPRPKIHQNGKDSENNNKFKLENKFAENNKDDNDACVNCLYYTQQLCECVIL
ncbi:probable serine/threonine-protein kinase DDB_G0282963 isoform X1 [Microplitis mediator]|uniref:probable serine/threonine-protein kinase DDB_G0282963 isoform X1 n=1 Tax=Microplitis mediator TaxID=375433 RepID=UPI002553518B|nr:probable serine/threonine-protein kinase DDB_G0282963 isoform X1 [Microplitis mediator]